MSVGILENNDANVAKWTWAAFGKVAMPVNRAFGLMKDGKLVGSFMFQHFNGINVEFSYYGEWTVTAGIFKYALRVALEKFKVERMTFLVPRDKKRMIKWLQKMGCVHEGNCRRYYGRDDKSSNTAVRLALFREDMEWLVNGKPNIEGNL